MAADPRCVNVCMCSRERPEDAGAATGRACAVCVDMLRDAPAAYSSVRVSMNGVMHRGGCDVLTNTGPVCRGPRFLMMEKKVESA